MRGRRVSPVRIRLLNDAPVRESGTFVLYWMTAARRMHDNFGLQRAAEWAVRLKKPVVVLEALRCDYPYSSDRLHGFILEGMAENLKSNHGARCLYYPYVERKQGEGKGLVQALAALSAVVVTDDFPCFFLPRMHAAASRQLSVCFEAVDSNGLLPLRAPDLTFRTAFSFRRYLQKHLPPYLMEFPKKSPLSRLPDIPTSSLPRKITTSWPPADRMFLEGGSSAMSGVALNHKISTTDTRGGSEEGRRVLKRFVRDRLNRYHEDVNHPDLDASSGLSPYLHFGHVSAFQVFSAVVKRESWKPEELSGKVTGKRLGWWGMSPGAEAFLDQLVTWRELGFNMCARETGYDRFSTLPDWAIETLKGHSGDKRPYLYTLDQFEGARTHDPLWNAAQRQLLREGTIHNYLRMLWGKKILHWTPSPEEALDIMIELNNKYALDGRDPNSYSGIFWVLGRYDRPWGPERPVFGKVRYMSSQNTVRKLKLKDYLARFT